jgi:hypothetical protein
VREAVNIIDKYHGSAQDDRIVPVFTDRSETMDGSQAKTSATENQPAGEEDAVEQLLGGILEQLRLLQKKEAFDEFSLMRLLAGIVQIFVPFCLLVALWLQMSSREPNQNVLVALGFGAVLQLMALTFYIMNWRR